MKPQDHNMKQYSRSLQNTLDVNAVFNIPLFQSHSSTASFLRADLNIAAALSHLRDIILGASLEYRINAATTIVYPPADREANLHMLE